MSIFGDDFLGGPKPKTVTAADLQAMDSNTLMFLLENALHKVEVTALQKGTARLYAVRRWVIFDEAKELPMTPPDTDEEKTFTDDAVAAADYANDLAARTAEEDRRLYE